MKTSTHLRAGDAPPGSYQFSCRAIRFSEQSRALDAECQEMNGRWSPDAIIVPPDWDGDIANCNGMLVLGGC
jgi:hypothetical protein